MIKRKHAERAKVSSENSGPVTNDYTLREWVMMYERFSECGLKPILFFFTFFHIHFHPPFFFTGFGKMESRNKCGREQIGAPGNSEMLFSTSIAALEKSTSAGCRLEMGYMDWFAFSNYR